VILNEGDEMICVWTIAGRNRDFQAYLCRRAEGKKLHLEYRFRYYVDDKVFDSKDRKSWYAFEATGTEDEAIEKIDFMCENIVGEGFAKVDDAFLGAVVDKVVVRGGIDKFEELMKGKPYMHWRVEKLH